MTKKEKEAKQQEDYKKWIKARDEELIVWKKTIKWSKGYLIYFPIFLILLIITFILIFTLGKKGIYFIPVASVLFSSWAAIYLYFGLKHNYTSAATPLGFVFSVLIPIAGFIAGVGIAINLIRMYKDWLKYNSDENIEYAAFH